MNYRWAIFILEVLAVANLIIMIFLIALAILLNSESEILYLLFIVIFLELLFILLLGLLYFKEK